jgi:hypothetical protein
MTNRARAEHRRLDRGMAEAFARDGREHDVGPDIARPQRFRTKDLTMSHDSPMLRAARLWQKTSQRTGRVYYTGRLGGLRVLVVENGERRGEDEPSHFLLLGEAEQKPRDGVPAPAPAKGSAPAPAHPGDRGTGYRGPSAYRRPSSPQRPAPAADGHEPFYDDDLSGIGR